MQREKTDTCPAAVATPESVFVATCRQQQRFSTLKGMQDLMKSQLKAGLFHGGLQTKGSPTPLHEAKE